jgi:allophanate hydrolase subunit 2
MDNQSRGRVAGWILLALAGLAVAVVLSVAASNLSTQSIGLEGQPLRAGDRLAPTSAGTTRSSTTKKTTRTTTTPARTQTTTTTSSGDDHGGRGRGRGGSGSSGRGGHGGDDD